MGNIYMVAYQLENSWEHQLELGYKSLSLLQTLANKLVHYRVYGLYMIHI